MGRRTTPGTKLFSAEVTESLLAEFQAYAKGRGERMRTALERAMRREMGNPPPPVVDPPLPPVAPSGPEPAAKPKGKKR